MTRSAAGRSRRSTSAPMRAPVPSGLSGRKQTPRNLRRESGMIEARGLSKRYGDKLAVDDLSFTVRPGRVTGFLGAHGAGKTTTTRMTLGLHPPTAGSVPVNGKPFAEVYSAMR